VFPSVISTVSGGAREAEDDRSLEVECAWQRRLDCAGRHRRLDHAGRHRRLDRDCDSDLDFARVRGGEQPQRKVTAAQDHEAEHGCFGHGFGCVGCSDHSRLHDSKEWVPLTKIGRLVKTGKLRKVEEAYHMLPIKEQQVFETLVPRLTAAHRELLVEEHRELEVDQRRMELDHTRQRQLNC